MLRTGVAEALRAERGEEGYLFPDYGGYCFARVPATALSLLGADAGPTLPADVIEGVDTDVDTVVVALVDGYGFEQYRRDHADYPLLDRLARRGTVTPLTSVYPSETAAAITTVHTGLLPVDHGLLGWDQYDDDLDAVVQALPFTTEDGESVAEAFGADPRMLFEGDSLYGRLDGSGVEATAVVPEGQLTSAYSGIAMDGVGGREYGAVTDAGAALGRTVEAAAGPTYVYAYFPHVDAAAHLAGTTSDAYHDRLGAVTSSLRGFVEDLDPAAAERTLLLLVADHGEVDTPGAEGNVDLRAGRFDPLWDALARDGDGEPIPPVGGPRNVQLHLQEGRVAATRGLLADELDARVFTREEAIECELFGPDEPRGLFRRRLGDLVVVPCDRSVWYDESGCSYVGMHGGLHPDEMLVPFAAARVDRLQG